MKCIKGYKSMSKERLLSGLDESESVGSGNNVNNARIKKIREDFNKLRDRFLKPKINEIRRNLYETENNKYSCSGLPAFESGSCRLRFS